MSTEIPADLRYTKEHEWARVEGDLVVVGITAHAVEQLGDITLVTLPEPGTTVRTGDSFGDIDSVKAVSELFAPLDGEVVETNAALDDAPESVNGEPYGAGWMIKLRPSDPAAVEQLMNADAYGKYLADL
jgi:glycine cleavage system H protein